MGAWVGPPAVLVGGRHRSSSQLLLFIYFFSLVRDGAPGPVLGDVSTDSTAAPLLVSGGCWACSLLKSTTLSFVVLAPPCLQTHLTPVSSLLLMRPTAVADHVYVFPRQKVQQIVAQGGVTSPNWTSYGGH